MHILTSLMKNIFLLNDPDASLLREVEFYLEVTFSGPLETPQRAGYRHHVAVKKIVDLLHHRHKVHILRCKDILLICTNSVGSSGFLNAPIRCPLVFS